MASCSASGRSLYNGISCQTGGDDGRGFGIGNDGGMVVARLRRQRHGGSWNCLKSVTSIDGRRWHFLGIERIGDGEEKMMVHGNVW